MTPPPTSSTSLARGLEPLLQNAVSRTEVHHAVLSVERGDGSFRWTGALGPAGPGGPEMETGTPFFIASVDKTMTAAVVLALAEEERLHLSQTLSDFLPREVAAGLHILNKVDRTDEITLQHLLGHTSGLPDWLEDRPRGGRSLVEEILEKGDREVSLEEVADRVRHRLTPHFPPQPLGEGRQRIVYSDTNYRLLTAVVEAVEERPVASVYRERLFKPLGLGATWVAGCARETREEARENLREGGTTPAPAALWAGDDRLEIPLLMSSFHGVYSTVGDLTTFLRSLVDDELFRNPGTGELMTRQWNRFPFHLELPPRRPGWPIEYGLGLMRFRLPRALTPFRPLPPVVGHTGSTGSWLFHCPDLDLYLSGTVDQVAGAGLPFRIVPRILALFRG